MHYCNSLIINRESMKHVKIPYTLVFKHYWARLLVVSLIWFIYDVSEDSRYRTDFILTQNNSSQPTRLESTHLKF